MENEPFAEEAALSEKLSAALLLCLQTRSAKVEYKYEYYDADNDIRDLNISTPRRMAHSRPGIGWASRAVNTLSDRVVFDGFAKDSFGINNYWTDINAWSVVGKAKHDAFIAGCAFVAVSIDSDGKEVLIPFTAQEATGEVDQKTGLLKYGLAVTRWEKVALGKNKGVPFAPADYVVFTPDFTAIYEGRTITEIVMNPTKRTLLHAVTHRASADRPLGKSRLTNTARRIIQEVGRLKRREEIAEEFYALPQRYINGLAEGATKDDNLDSAIGKVWAITKDEDGDKPEIGQLTQMNIDGFVEAKKDKARDFCAETALTLRNLGYETGNPSSVESLAAMSDDLLLEARNSQLEMGEEFKQIAITLRMAIDQIDVIPDGLKDLLPSWKPIFQVDVGAAGDALFKLFQSMPELQGTMAGYSLLGLGVRESEELMARRAANPSSNFMQNGGQ
jgi:hypothetical protein